MDVKFRNEEHDSAMWHVKITVDCSFFNLIFPLLNELDKLYWRIVVQQGQIDSTWLFKNSQNEIFYFSKIVDYSGSGKDSSPVYKPYSIGIFGQYIPRDENSIYFGFAESNYISLNDILFKLYTDGYGKIFINLLDLPGSIFINHIRANEWSIYSKSILYKNYFKHISNNNILYCPDEYCRKGIRPKLSLKEETRNE